MYIIAHPEFGEYDQVRLAHRFMFRIALSCCPIQFFVETAATVILSANYRPILC